MKHTGDINMSLAKRYKVSFMIEVFSFVSTYFLYFI